MRKSNSLLILLFLLTICIIPISNLSAGHYDIKETDTSEHALAYFFDLRERETFIQVTNTDSQGAVLHIQIWNVNDNCNENNFFDAFTPNDTHTYNMRDIITNDGNPSGVLLPENAYGAVIIYVGESDDFNDPDQNRPILLGNMRINDVNGYEYRTNGSGFQGSRQPQDANIDFTFNFNKAEGVTFSDIIHFRSVGSEDSGLGPGPYDLSDVLDAWATLDVNIVDLNENIFSCRDITFSCVNQDHPLLEELLNEANSNVASFEYGINESIPHSKEGPLLCPGNLIDEGAVTFDLIDDDGFTAALFLGLNNGNSRGSFDMWWWGSNVTSPSPDE